MWRSGIGLLLTALLGACTGASPAGSAGGVASDDSATSAAPAASGGETVTYEQGAATVSVDIDGSPFEFTDGTCMTETTTISVWELTSGPPLEPPSIDIYVGDAAGPIQDGSYSSGLELVTIFVGDVNYAVGELTVTLRDGLTAGEFSGTAAGNDPVPISGTFSCG